MASKKQDKSVNIAAAARKLLGFSSLRPGQEEAVKALLQGQDAVVMQPTGSGKSAIYQIAGDLLGGSAVVISPLIALQKDQAESIEESEGLKDAVVVNSVRPAAEQRETLQKIEDGEVQYIFLAPEQLRKRETIDVWRPVECLCLSSTKRTVSASGDMTSAPTTCNFPWPSKHWAIRLFSP